MALLVPDVGEARLLLELLDGGTTRENWSLRLYKNDITPAEGDVAGTYTVADFTDYANETLTRTVNNGVTWATVGTSGGTTSSEYVEQSWTVNSGGSAQDIYGYYFIGATSTLLVLAERFASAPRTLNPDDTLNLTPALELA